MRISALAGVILGAASVTAIPTITATGNKFFDSNGKQFYMKGMTSFSEPPCALCLLIIAIQALLTSSLSVSHLPHPGLRSGSLGREYELTLS